MAGNRVPDIDPHQGFDIPGQQLDLAQPKAVGQRHAGGDEFAQFDGMAVDEKGKSGWLSAVTPFSARRASRKARKWLCRISWLWPRKRMVNTRSCGARASISPAVKRDAVCSDPSGSECEEDDIVLNLWRSGRSGPALMPD